MDENMVEEYFDKKEKPEKFEKCDECKKEHHACTRVTYQYAEVSVPVKVKPIAKVGKIETQCCGNPIITDHMKKDDDCECKGVCELEITQTICVKIPIEYCAITDIGENKVKCGDVSNSCRCYKKDEDHIL